jgi:hypothetical protein
MDNASYFFNKYFLLIRIAMRWSYTVSSNPLGVYRWVRFSYERGYISSNALIITIFLIMYWPTRVRENGAWEKEISGKNTTGINVRTKCARAAIITFLS